MALSKNSTLAKSQAELENESGHLSPVYSIYLPENQELWSDSQFRRPHSPNPARNGGRQGPLCKEVRDQASIMRTLGVCLRCAIMRVGCSENVPCDQCTHKMRKWTWGCTKKGIGDRWEYVLPEILTAHLVGKSLNDLFCSDSHENHYSDSFTLRFSLGFGKHLPVEVRIVEPLGSARFERGVCCTRHSEGSFGAVRLNPQILPYLPNVDTSREQIKTHITEWLYDIAQDRNASVYLWQHHERWQNDVLSIICEYFLANVSDKAFSVIRRGLDLSFLTHLMIHTLNMPEEDLLFNRTHHKISVHDASPRAVNRWVKSVVLSLINEVGNEFLSEIHNVLHSKGHTPLAREVAFCAVFLCLAVLSKHQIAIQQFAIITDGHKNQPLTLDDAKKRIREMEHELADLLIYLCQHKARECQKKSKRGGHSFQSTVEVCAAQFGLFERIRKVTDDAKNSGYFFRGIQSLPSIDHSFMTTNDSRILTKFYEAMVPYLT